MPKPIFMVACEVCGKEGILGVRKYERGVGYPLPVNLSAAHEQCVRVPTTSPVSVFPWPKAVVDRMKKS